MGISEIDQLIQLARKWNGDIDEITVSADDYERLVQEIGVARNPLDRQPTGEWTLRYKNTRILKRECKGCCQHG